MSEGESTTITKRPDDRFHDASPVRAQRLIVAFECRRPLCPGLRLSLADVDEVVIGRGPERKWSRADRQLTVRLPDSETSRLHVRLEREGDGWTLHDLGSKNGTSVAGARMEHCTLADHDLIEIGGTLLVYRDRNEAGGVSTDRDLALENPEPAVFRTLSLELERRLAELVRIAPTLVPVLIRGETGTGKELVAETIHKISTRPGPFVPVNCGALPRTLVESELFGYRRGAFSGAREDRKGLARTAHGGTLFLDEVAELPDDAQVALLRLLQEGEVRPIGAADLVRVDVRVVAATHQDLAARIAEGRFRRDLYARLAGYEMMLAPLRERPEDLGSLIAALLRRIGLDEAAEPSIHPRAAFALLSHSYPMNVRELEQALRAAVALAPRGELRLEHLPPAIRASADTGRQRFDPEDAQLHDRLVELLRQNRGNVRATARALDKAPVQIRRWCSRLGIAPDEFRRG